MAVYFNLAIDCDQDEKSAEQLTSVFEDIVISTERFGELICDSYCTLPNFFWSTGLGGAPSDYAGDWYKVCVCPREMSMPQDHPGILDEQNMNHVRSKLYQHLRRGLDLGHQFRAAAFGWEVQDVLGDADWLGELKSINQTGQLPRGMEGLILNEAQVTNESVERQLEPFGKGYVWWNAPCRGY